MDYQAKAYRIRGKEKDMTTVRFAYYLNSERRSQSLYEEQSGLFLHAHIRKSRGKE